jgi:hypothetical protein
MKSSKKTIPSYLLTFGMTMIVSVVFMTIGTLAGMLNVNNMEQALIASEYHDHLAEETKLSVENILLTAGLEQEIVEGIIVKDTFLEQSKTYIEKTLSGQETHVDISDMLGNLEKSLKEYLSKKDIKVDSKVEKGITIMMDEIKLTCLNAIKNPLFRYLYEYGLKHRHILYYVLAALLVILGAFHVVLVRMHRMPHRGWNYIAYGWLAGSLISVVLPIYGLITRLYARVNLSPKYFNMFFSEYFKQSLYDYLFVGLIGIIIYMLIMVYVVRSRNKQIEQAEMRQNLSI